MSRNLDPVQNSAPSLRLVPALVAILLVGLGACASADSTDSTKTSNESEPSASAKPVSGPVALSLDECQAIDQSFPKFVDSVVGQDFEEFYYFDPDTCGNWIVLDDSTKGITSWSWDVSVFSIGKSSFAEFEQAISGSLSEPVAEQLPTPTGWSWATKLANTEWEAADDSFEYWFIDTDRRFQCEVSTSVEFETAKSFCDSARELATST